MNERLQQLAREAGHFEFNKWDYFDIEKFSKSMLNHMFTPTKFTILDQAPVDGATWYTVSCSREVSIWLREQSEELQKHNLSCEKWPMYSNKYDIHEKLYTVLALQWS
jgi:hypothetical protein